MKLYVLACLLISATSAQAGSLNPFIGIPLGERLSGTALRDPAPLGHLPIYTIRMPLGPPFNQFFHDATVNVALADDRIGLVRAERAYASEAECIRASIQLIDLIRETSGVKPDSRTQAGHMFSTEAATADVGCSVSAGARFHVLSATATDIKTGEKVSEYLRSLGR